MTVMIKAILMNPPGIAAIDNATIIEGLNHDGNVRVAV